MKSRVLKTVAMIGLVAWSLEILAHRWLWHQVPTQVPTFAVYGLVLLNLGLGFRYFSALGASR